MSIALDDAQLLRFSRHILLPQLGVEGQQAIAQSRVLLIGLGGLGSPIALYLASSGVGELILVDDDHVDLGNLQRQIVHQQASLGMNKAVSAAERLAALNPEALYRVIEHRLNQAELVNIATDVDLIVDASDNFATRYLLNAVSLKTRVPLVSGAAIRFEGQISVFNARPESPCYRCLYPEQLGDEEQRCSENGVIAPLVGVIGSLQALEALKILARIGTSLDGKLTIFDALQQQWRTIKLAKDPHCPDCSSEP